MAIWFGWSAVGALLALNVALSVVVLRNARLGALQRSGQLALVWIAPVVGALICVVLARIGPVPPGDPLAESEASAGFEHLDLPGVFAAHGPRAPGSAGRRA